MSSWRASQCRKGRFQRRCSSNRVHNRRKPTASLRADSQQLVAQLLLESNGAVDVGALERIFGSASPEHILRLLLRVKLLKGRDEALFSAEQVEMWTLFPKRLKEKGRNVHHLTPRCRKDQPFFGDNRHNFLLMKVSRHDALHEVFGVRTWEEIIVLLSRCVAEIRQMNFDIMIDLIQRAFRKSGRRKARRALRNLQLGFGPGFSRGLPFFTCSEILSPSPGI